MKVQKKPESIHASAAAAALSAAALPASPPAAAVALPASPLRRRQPRCRHLLYRSSRVAGIRYILNNAPALFPLCKKNDPGIKPQGRFCLLLRLRAVHPSSELFLRQRFSQSATSFWACLNCSATILPAQASRCNVVEFAFSLFASFAGRLTLAALTGRPSSTGRANCSTRIRQRALHQERPQNQPWALRQAEDASPGSPSRFPARSW